MPDGKKPKLTPWGLEQVANIPGNGPISKNSAAQSAAFDTKTDSKATQKPIASDTRTAGTQDGDFAAALAMIAALPLSASEKAKAVRRLIAGGK
jgi:hypothetical protein